MLWRYLPNVASLLAYALLGGNGPPVLAAESIASRVLWPVIHGILYKEDGGNCCSLDPTGAMKPERLDTYVDELADSQVTVSRTTS
jgi:hypothetical protein